MLSDPGLVIVQPVQVNQKLHVAIESEQRVFVQRMKGSEKNPCLQKPVVHSPDLFSGFRLADFDRSDNRSTNKAGTGRHFAWQQPSESNVRFVPKADILRRSKLPVVHQANKLVEEAVFLCVALVHSAL